MFRLPEYADYLEHIQNYDHYLAIVIVAAIILAFMLPTIFRKKVQLKIGFNLPTILAIGLLVRIPLMNQPYWYDEAFTSAMTQVGMTDFFTAIQGDVHPPVYYLIFNALVTIFGPNDFTM